jgi:pimeloyl-ACP methyl ester carboxylesterase
LEDNLSKYSEVASTAVGPIEYAIQGQGPVVLAIHGTPGGYDHSLWLCKDMADSGQFTLLSVSRPGYGRTPLSAGKSPAEQADALVALLDSLGIKKVAAVAFSGGGPAALQLAR